MNRLPGRARVLVIERGTGFARDSTERKAVSTRRLRRRKPGATATAEFNPSTYYGRHLKLFGTATRAAED
jgi:hypothetical protein